MVRPPPVTLPFTLSVPETVVTVLFPLRLTSAVVRLFEPVNVKSPAHDWELARTIGAPEVLSIVPPWMVNSPKPRAELVLIWSVPLARVVPPECRLLPERASVPGP